MLGAISQKVFSPADDMALLWNPKVLCYDSPTRACCELHTIFPPPLMLPTPAGLSILWLKFQGCLPRFPTELFSALGPMQNW